MVLKFFSNFIQDFDWDMARTIFFEYRKSILKFFEYLLKEKLGLPIGVDIIMYKEIVGDLDIVRDTAIVGNVTVRGSVHIMEHAHLSVMPHAHLRMMSLD